MIKIQSAEICKCLIIFKSVEGYWAVFLGHKLYSDKIQSLEYKLQFLGKVKVTWVSLTKIAVKKYSHTQEDEGIGIDDVPP